jgi:hypothetical protein
VVIGMDVSTMAEALFASPLRPADRPAAAQVRAAIAASLQTLGIRGCLGAMAEEFGDHPHSAAARMRWALTLVRSL